MGILNKLLSNYGDDLAEAAGKTAANYTDDFVSRWGKQIAEAGANKSDDAMRALLNKRGNKDMVRDAFMAMQPEIPGKDLSSMFRASTSASALVSISLPISAALFCIASTL